MRKISAIVMLSAIILTPSAFALHSGMSDSKSCHMIAKACKKAGFSREDGKHKLFWENCMEPVILGKSVKGVAVDHHTVKTCRADKIHEMKEEIEKMEKAG